MNSDKNQPPIDCDQVSTTIMRKRQTAKATFIWKIKGFKEQRNEYSQQDYICSADFDMKSPYGNMTSWCLKMFPIGRGLYGADSVKFKIFVKRRDVAAKVDVSLLSSTGQKMLPWSCQKRDFVKGEEFEILNCNYLDITDESKKLLPNGEMSVVCDITIYERNSCTVDYISENLKAFPGQSHDQFRDNFMELLNSKEMSDVRIKCADQTFDAHQFVLSVRSPVFHKMFQAEMEEKESGLIEIKDIKPEVLSHVLRFIYSGDCACILDLKTDVQTISDIFEAAHKYQLDFLYQMCEEAMTTRIKAETSLQVRFIIDDH